MPLTQAPTLRFRPLLNIQDEPLVNGLWSSAFKELGGLRIYNLQVRQKNDEIAAKDMNIRLIIDGHVYESLVYSMNSGDWYFIDFSHNEDELQFDVDPHCFYNNRDGFHIFMDMISLQILIGIDTLVGTNQVYDLQMRFLGG
jgi:hypothetical protein